jgi:hypothetical protein
MSGRIKICSYGNPLGSPENGGFSMKSITIKELNNA